MTMDLFRQPDHPQTHLLLPGMPTPNGRLHLGHISGPFLKMDVIARSLRRAGHTAGVVSCSDSPESYVTLRSFQTGEHPEVVAHEFHKGIRSDLEQLDLDMLYLDPLGSDHKEAFEAEMRSFQEAVLRSGKVIRRKEKFAVAPEEKYYGTGCWISGRCPVCQSGSGSYVCENCGTHYRAMDLGNPTYNFDHEPGQLREIELETLWLKISDVPGLLGYLENIQFPPGMEEIAPTYLAHQGPYIRLTNPDRWGFPWPVPGSAAPQVASSYTHTLGLGVFCGKIWAAQRGLRLHPMHRESDAIVSASFGIDNAVPYFVGHSGVARETDYCRPYNHLIGNYFAYLQGEKFSTSRRHAIWASEVSQLTPLHSDAVRYFLVKVNPEYRSSNFLVDALIATVREDLVDGLQNRILAYLPALDRSVPAALPDRLAQALGNLIVQQQMHLDPGKLALTRSLAPLREWWEDAEAVPPTQHYWWLKGLALLAAPILPFTAQWLWATLGGRGVPTLAAFPEPTPPQDHFELPNWFQPVSYSDLSPCLPTHLTLH
ncbi:MAG: class I tRNA ligase family protein [Bacteroidota bacterium]